MMNVSVCGYAASHREWLHAPRADGSRFARLLTRPGSPADLPRPTITPVDVKTRSALARTASRAFYLDLSRLIELQDQRNTPFTPPVHAGYALVEALRELEEQGGAQDAMAGTPRLRNRCGADWRSWASRRCCHRRSRPWCSEPTVCRRV